MNIFKKTIIMLSVVSVLLLLSNFVKQYSENKIQKQQNEIIKLQNKLNAELGRVQYYLTVSNRNENIGLLLLLYDDVKASPSNSSIEVITDNGLINKINKRKEDLALLLEKGSITEKEYYSQMLEISRQMFGSHLDVYNNLNTELNNKIENRSSWSFLSKLFTTIQLLLILINVFGQAVLIAESVKAKQVDIVL